MLYLSFVFLYKKKESIQKAQNIFEFFKSTLAVNVAVCLVTFLLGGPDAVFFIFLSFGFVVSLAVKEVNYKNEYLFYYNNKISKMELWLCAWCLNFIFLIAGVLFYNLLIRLF